MHDPSQEGELEETEKINVVPLADLTLVLLIVLMVLSPMISQSMIHVAVPTIKNEGAGDTPKENSTETPPEPLLVAISGDGYTLNNAKVENFDALMVALDARLKENVKRPVLVTAAKSIPVGRVVEVLDLAKGVGAESVSLVKSGEDLPGGKK